MTRSPRSVHCWIAAFATLAVLSANAAPRKVYGKIELIRDKWGVANVFSDTDAGAMYGLGYANAEDRAFQMYYSLRIMQGRLAELVGNPVKKTKWGDAGGAVAHDRKMRAMAWTRYAEKTVASLKPETRGLLKAFSEGVNDGMEAAKANRHYLFDKLGLDPEPWTPEACIISWWHIAQYFAGDGLDDLNQREKILQNPKDKGMSLFRKADDNAAVVTRDDIDPAWLAEARKYAKDHGIPPRPPASENQGPKMSHGWVVGKDKTTNGAAVLVSDPQTAVNNPSIWYEFNFSGKTLHGRGVGAAGCPTLLIGFTPNVSWGLTALGSDQADLFILKTDDAHPNQYMVDDKWREMKVHEETIKVKGGKDVKIAVRESHYGPVMTEFADQGEAFEAGRVDAPSSGPAQKEAQKPGPASRAAGKPVEVALKRVPFATTDCETVEANFDMIRAKDAKEFLEATSGWTFPSANCFFGDSKGNIGYTVVLGLPIRSTKALNWGGAAFDGSSSDEDWQGLLPAHLLPHVINPKRGWVGSGNHLTIVRDYPIPLGVGVGGGGHTNRSYRVYERLKAKEKFTPEDVLDITRDMVPAEKRDVVMLGRHVRDVMKKPLSTNANKTLEHLKGWYDKGAKSDMSVPGTELANMLNINFREQTTPLAFKFGGGISGLLWWLDEVKGRIAKDPTLALTDDEVAFVEMTLTSNWKAAVQKYGEDESAWLAKAQEQARNVTMGYFVCRDGFPSVDKANDLKNPELTCIDGGTILSQGGQSYTQYVPMNDVDQALGVMPIGISEKPDAPSRLSNVDMWKNMELRPCPISRKAVEKIAGETVKLSG